ncbi:unnamed protein product [Urochloa decumbens]|uniref:NAC domain-containing protein n=1 Tax=Urochloa decumbens TaxID=240449 RepID=A0ABC9DFC3_9POAL
MTGTTWIIDGSRFATKIKSASGSSDPSNQKWMGNPSKECPKCSHVIDNSDVVHQWPGLPKGVKFDPSAQELLWHLMAKHGKPGTKPHPFIDEFIPTVEEEDGICYTHPQKLPGVKQDGSVSHFFHRTFKAYNTGTRKRRKINTGDLADVRWHKTGKTKPVLFDGKQRGCKKIMVLYMSTAKGGKAEKTNWVMHQYHLGTGEDEKEGQYVVSKLFFQQQFKPGEKNAQELTAEDGLESMADEADVSDFTTLPSEEHVGTIQEVVQNPERNPYQVNGNCEINIEESAAEDIDGNCEINIEENAAEDIDGNCEINIEENAAEEIVVLPPSEKPEGGDNSQSQDPKLWEGDSQFELLDSQQLAEGLALCDEFLMSQSQTSCGGGDEPREIKPRLAVYAQLPAEDFKKDLEECQRLEPSNAVNLELDNTTEFRLSQIDFSQDSFTNWAGGKMIDD